MLQILNVCRFSKCFLSEDFFFLISKRKKSSCPSVFYIKAESQSGFRNGFHKVETYPRTKSHNLSMRALVFWRNSLCFGVYTLPNITVQLRRVSILAFNTSYYKHAALFTGLHCRAIWLVDVAKRIVLIWNCSQQSSHILFWISGSWFLKWDAAADFFSQSSFFILSIPSKRCLV